MYTGILILIINYSSNINRDNFRLVSLVQLIDGLTIGQKRRSDLIPI